MRRQRGIPASFRAIPMPLSWPEEADSLANTFSMVRSMVTGTMDISPTTLADFPVFQSNIGGGRSYHGSSGRDSDCIPRDVISFRQVIDVPIDPIFDLLGEREFLIKKLHLKRSHRLSSRRSSARATLLSQIR